MADKYQIPFINACIRAFAKRVGLPVKNVFQYLDRFKGVEFLVDFYPTLHLQILILIRSFPKQRMGFTSKAPRMSMNC